MTQSTWRSLSRLLKCFLVLQTHAREISTYYKYYHQSLMPGAWYFMPIQHLAYKIQMPHETNAKKSRRGRQLVVSDPALKPSRSKTAPRLRDSKFSFGHRESLLRSTARTDRLTN
uniref:Putative secreted protein n=1 Tax=Amblyomma cajennense TaxID=34607 RepID=A0A023FDX5_AMBCJ